MALWIQRDLAGFWAKTSQFLYFSQDTIFNLFWRRKKDSYTLPKVQGLVEIVPHAIHVFSGIFFFDKIKDETDETKINVNLFLTLFSFSSDCPK